MRVVATACFFGRKGNYLCPISVASCGYGQPANLAFQLRFGPLISSGAQLLWNISFALRYSSSAGTLNIWRPNNSGFLDPSQHNYLTMLLQRLWVIWGQCCLRVAASPFLPNGPITQLSPYFTRNPCICSASLLLPSFLTTTNVISQWPPVSLFPFYSRGATRCFVQDVALSDEVKQKLVEVREKRNLADSFLLLPLLCQSVFVKKSNLRWKHHCRRFSFRFPWHHWRHLLYKCPFKQDQDPVWFYTGRQS